MWQFIVWTCIALFFLGLSWTSGHQAKDAWDRWHKKDDAPPMKIEQFIKDSPNSTAYQAGRDINKN